MNALITNDKSAGRQARSALRLTICGGGASAVLMLKALHELAHRPLSVTVIEPRKSLGLGLAYSTFSPVHLLNTPAARMSANGDAQHFVQWLREHRPREAVAGGDDADREWGPRDFAPRRDYGAYLQTQLDDIRADAALELTKIEATVEEIVRHGDGWVVRLPNNDTIEADVVLLATGNELPRPVGEHLPPLAQHLLLNDPWDAARKAQIPRDAAVLLGGTGLTAMDVAVELLERGHRGHIFAFSRRGLLPRAHGVTQPASAEFKQTLPAALADLLEHVRRFCANDAGEGRWRGVFDELRAHAASLWRAWDMNERRRFLRHLRPFWEVHRHRVAPAVAERIEAASARGQFRAIRGRLQSIESLPSNKLLHVTLSAAGRPSVLEVARFVNCMGPETDPERVFNPLLLNLVSSAVAQPDGLGLGVATDIHSRVLAPDGSGYDSLYALGPLARAAHWEITAVPEIREQTKNIARRILEQTD